jgi:hypothetical protein
MAARTALSLRLASAPAPRRGLAGAAAKVGSELVLGLVLLAGATVAVVLLCLLVVVAAPVAAALAAWLVWRSGDVAARETRRIRARLRRRARALGLVVLAGSQPALFRLAAAARTKKL